MKPIVHLFVDVGVRAVAVTIPVGNVSDGVVLVFAVSTVCWCVDPISSVSSDPPKMTSFVLPGQGFPSAINTKGEHFASNKYSSSLA